MSAGDYLGYGVFFMTVFGVYAWAVWMAIREGQKERQLGDPSKTPESRARDAGL